MSQRFPFLFTSLFCALIGIATGWTLSKMDNNSCEERTTHAYLTGKQVGLAEAQQSGACVRWWTGTSVDDMRAAKRLFCKGR